MEQSELDSLRITLEQMLKEATRRSVSLEEIAVESAADAVDYGQRVAERDLAIHLIETKFDRAQRIKLALGRIADGTYGICLMCDGEITLKRMHAVPWTAYCVNCQEVAESERIPPEDERVKALMNLKDVA